MSTACCGRHFLKIVVGEVPRNVRDLRASSALRQLDLRRDDVLVGNDAQQMADRVQAGPLLVVRRDHPPGGFGDVGDAGHPLSVPGRGRSG